MKNEVLCKVLCHNICCLLHAIYELGITPTFPRLKSGETITLNLDTTDNC
jgi:hypothetical protein